MKALKSLALAGVLTGDRERRRGRLVVRHVGQHRTDLGQQLARIGESTSGCLGENLQIASGLNSFTQALAAGQRRTVSM